MINILIFLRERKSSFFGDAGLTNLQRSLTELFGAGSETSATTLLFAFLYMIKHPEVQVSSYFISICIIHNLAELYIIFTNKANFLSRKRLKPKSTEWSEKISTLQIEL